MKSLFSTLSVGPIEAMLHLEAQTPAHAQAPPHRDDGIWVTPKLWSRQKPPGRKGNLRTCVTPYGSVKGTLR